MGAILELLDLALLAQGKVAAGGVTPLTALLVGVTAAVLGAVLTLTGGFISDYFASRREERQQDREDRRQREQRDHEYRMQGVQRAQEEKASLHEKRLRAYQAFLANTSLHERTALGSRAAKHTAIYSSYIETVLYASDYVSTSASALYAAADKAVDAEDEDENAWATLTKARSSFLKQARREAQESLANRVEEE